MTSKLRRYLKLLQQISAGIETISGKVSALRAELENEITASQAIGDASATQVAGQVPNPTPKGRKSKADKPKASKPKSDATSEGRKKVLSRRKGKVPKRLDKAMAKAKGKGSKSRSKE